MKFVADLHIHSYLSRATSARNRLHELSTWAKLKGINVLGTGDFTHPVWLSEIEDQLTESEPGLFRLKKPSLHTLENKEVVNPESVRFILSSEISSIYKKNGKVRKVHSLIFSPDLKTAHTIHRNLAKIGNLESDGRPILGLDVKHLLEIIMEVNPSAYLIPAHIWTPWFSVLGSKSGFDSIEECFEDLAPHIFALETGLSSDPLMNWMLSSLDRFSLISNSDAHSPEKLGREANLFDCELDYFSLFDALKSKTGFSGTIEFFPEEGKYHFDGHRKCGIVLHPEETLKHKNLCPVCGKTVTIGVMNRVYTLADRKKPQKPKYSPAFHSFIPLKEIIAETLGTTPASKKAEQEYFRLVQKYGSEFQILFTEDEALFSDDSNPLIPIALKRMHENKVIRTPGYDGEYGKISLFTKEELQNMRGQHHFTWDFPLESHKKNEKKKPPNTKKKIPFHGIENIPHSSNPEQEEAIHSPKKILTIHAGPGSGKTRTLIHRIHFSLQKGTPPESILAITFTNRASTEMKVRLAKMTKQNLETMTVSTIHKFCLSVLKELQIHFKMILDENDRKTILEILFPSLSRQELAAIQDKISLRFKFKQPSTDENIEQYENHLQKAGFIDLEQLVSKTCSLLSHPGHQKQILQKYRHVFVDEFQDLDPFQYELLEIMAKGSDTFFAIGDLNQSIYGFRGANPGLFADFRKSISAESVHLNRNYRNAPNILRAAEAIISKNENFPFVPQKTEIAFPGYVALFEAASEKSEAKHVINSIEQLVGGTSFSSFDKHDNFEDESLSFGNIAVLFRSRVIIKELENQFKQSGIPFQICGDRPFYLKPPVESLVQFLKISTGDLSFSLWQNFLKNQFKIPSKIIHQFFHWIESNNETVPAFADCITFLCGQTTLNIHINTLKALKETGENLWNKKASVPESINKMINLLNIPPEKPEIQKFSRLLAPLDLSEVLQFLEEENESMEKNKETVSLLTFHASKGLEFDAVFIIGCEETILPFTLKKDVDLSEERRLFYVGITRAKKYLYLSLSRKRMLFGQETKMNQSHFLNDIPRNLISIKKHEPSLKKASKNLQLELF